MSVFNFDMMKNMQSEKFELFSINYFKTNFIMESNLLLQKETIVFMTILSN